MRVLWTFLKVVIALALAIPLCIIVLATALGILGALVGIAILALKVGIIALVGYGAFRLIARLVGSPARVDRHRTVKDLPPADPYYQAAMSELDRDLGGTTR
ncbi:MAG TPA: hypothetical protein VJN70_00555 [Gemmatimonadaceae bacterium]|nr:hypothetical protein [Gemmatimonadaceae bacterium]